MFSELNQKNLRKNAGINLGDTGLGNSFLDITKHKQQKKKHKLDFNELKAFESKDTIKKVKRQPTEWEKMFANHVSHKDLVSKIYKVPLHFNNNPI